MPPPAGTGVAPACDSCQMGVSQARVGGLRRQHASLECEVGDLLLWALCNHIGPVPPLSPIGATRLVGTARRHGVAAFVHDALARRGALGILGSEALESLSRLRRDAAAQYLRALFELEVIGTAFAGSGIEWVVIKGPAVASLAYEEPTLRSFVDIDVLVSGKHFGPALAALSASGALLVDNNWDLQLQLRRAEADLLLPMGTPVDVHWHLVNEVTARTSTRFDLKAMMSRRLTMRAENGTEFPVLDAVDNMLVVALHGSLSGGHRLSWSKDIEALSRRAPPDWGTLRERAQEAQVGPAVGLMLHRAARLLDAQVPGEVVTALLGTRPWGDLLKRAERRATPASLAGGTGTGRLIMSSLRASPHSTAQTFLRGAAGELVRRLGTSRVRGLARRKGVEGQASVNPLRQPAASPGAREAYLSWVTTHSGRGHPLR